MCSKMTTEKVNESAWRYHVAKRSTKPDAEAPDAVQGSPERWLRDRCQERCLSSLVSSTSALSMRDDVTVAGLTLSPLRKFDSCHGAELVDAGQSWRFACEGVCVNRKPCCHKNCV